MTTRILNTLEVLKDMLFDLCDNSDPALNYIKAVENAIAIIELFGNSDIGGQDYAELEKLLTFPTQYT